MICKNCNSEIGNRIECTYCGYNPMIDEAQNIDTPNEITSLPPVEINIKKGSNVLATVGLILSFFSVFPLCYILSFIFSLIALKNSKRKRCGKKRAIFALIILLSVVLVLALLVGFGIAFTLNPNFSLPFIPDETMEFAKTFFNLLYGDTV